MSSRRRAARCFKSCDFLRTERSVSRRGLAELEAIPSSFPSPFLHSMASCSKTSVFMLVVHFANLLVSCCPSRSSSFPTVGLHFLLCSQPFCFVLPDPLDANLHAPVSSFVALRSKTLADGTAAEDWTGNQWRSRWTTKRENLQRREDRRRQATRSRQGGKSSR